MKEKKPTKPTKASDENASCKHDWQVTDPGGTISVGVCNVCGVKQEFRNSVEYSYWTSRGRMPKRSAKNAPKSASKGTTSGK